MKFICTMALMLPLSFPVFAQVNNFSSSDDLRNETLNSAQKLISTLLSEKLHLKIYKNPHYLYKANPGFGFIPIPPATESERQAELIPLYKDGERIIKFIKK
jgi:hypothetical protein